MPVSVFETDPSLTHHRLEASATPIVPPEEVREKFKRVKPLKDISVTQRGWRLDVLNAVRRIGGVGTPRCGVRTSQRDVPANTFTTADAYAFTPDIRHRGRPLRAG
ncbi:MAG: hypothetical protein ACLPYZ_03805 [Limisphaerales bacterium]